MPNINSENKDLLQVTADSIEMFTQKSCFFLLKKKKASCVRLNVSLEVHLHLMHTNWTENAGLK